MAYDFILTLPGVGLACDAYPEECKKAINVGMTYAMTSVGLPPSVPNWDQLKQEGLDYFAHEIAEQMEEEGVPTPLTEFALKQLTQEVLNELTANRGSSTNLAFSWIERWYGFAPSSWSVAVQKNGPDPIIGGMRFQTKQSALFKGTVVPLPKVFPAPLPGLTSTVLRLPVVLAPNLANIPAPLCRSSWYTTPRRQCFPLPAFVQEPICQFQFNNGPNSPWQPDPGCERMGEMVQVYYRNAWVEGKFLSAPCTTIAGVTLAEVGGTLYIPIPGLTFFVGASVQPGTELMWDGPVGFACGP